MHKITEKLIVFRALHDREVSQKATMKRDLDCCRFLSLVTVLGLHTA
jgi:hypothetical protein